MNNNQISETLNNISDRQIRKNDLELLLNNNSKRKATTRGIRVMFTAAACAAVFGIGLIAGAAATDGFTSGFTSSFKSEAGYDPYFDQPTVKFTAASYEGAPETIGQTYAPAILKEGIHYRKTVYMTERRTEYSVNYVPETEDRINKPFWSANIMQLIQETKADFRDTFNTPKYVDVKEITINGCPGFVVSQERYCGTLNVVIWDNGDYIFRLRCVSPEEEALRIAESIVPCDEATGEVLS